MSAWHASGADLPFPLHGLAHLQVDEFAQALKKKGQMIPDADIQRILAVRGTGCAGVMDDSAAQRGWKEDGLLAQECHAMVWACERRIC